MTELLAEWLREHAIEIFGAILGLLYIFFSIRQSILTWPTGLFTSLLYVFVFYQTKFYADMGLQVYYVFISIYGWYNWQSGSSKNHQVHDQVPVKQTPLRLILVLMITSVLIFLVLWYILAGFTDSDVSVMDSITTALSIVATWMLAKKYIEHWLVWIFVDAVSAGLYIYKELWPTTILFLVYTVMAFAGWHEWKKDLNKVEYAT